MKWKTSPHHFSFLYGVSVLVALCAVISPTVTQDSKYIPTHLVDPLQPVWDALDRIPREVSNTVLPAISKQFDTRLNEEMAPITNTLQEVIMKLQCLMPGANNVTFELSTQVFRNELAEAVTKLEGHIDTKVQQLETKLKEHIDSRLLSVSSNYDGGNGSGSLAQTLRNNNAALENITAHVIKINEKLGGSSEGGDSCTTLVDKVSELMGSSAGGGGGGGAMVCPSVNQGVSVSSALPRDCSDKHWQQPQAPSGVYETFPTLDQKDPVSTYCDMGDPTAKKTGGWTVILRRQNSTFGLVNFNRTWASYRRGFGDPGEGEWWFGLSFLHALTYRQPFEVDLLLHDIEKGTFHATYTTFRVEDESRDYKLILSGFKGNLTHDALTSKHNGSPFTTWDRDNDLWRDGNCGKSNGGGWWFNNCHFTTLTAPFPTSNDRNAKTMRWLEDDWLVLDDVTMKIRPFNYAERFNVHSTA